MKKIQDYKAFVKEMLNGFWHFSILSQYFSYLLLWVGFTRVCDPLHFLVNGNFASIDVILGLQQPWDNLDFTWNKGSNMYYYTLIATVNYHFFVRNWPIPVSVLEILADRQFFQYRQRSVSIYWHKCGIDPTPLFRQSLFKHCIEVSVPDSLMNNDRTYISVCKWVITV